jgi:hypothetical protein
MHLISWTSLRAIRATAMAFAAVGVFAIQAHGQTTLAFWNFDTLSGAATSLSADSGTGTLYVSPDHTGTPGTGVKTTPTSGTATGTTVNTAIPNLYGLNALSLANGTGGTQGNGEYIEIGLPLNGTQSNIGVSFATLKSSAPAFSANQWSYSTDGINFTNFGSVVNPVQGGYGLVGPFIAPALNGFNGTAYLRYTLNGASGTAVTPLNRIDNILIQSGAIAAPSPNPATLPAGGDIVFGLNNTDATNTLEFVRGPLTQGGGVRYPAPTYQYTTPSVPTPAPMPFIEAVRFDNYSNVSHNGHGNLIGVDFGVTTAGTGGGKIYSMATTGSASSPAAQLIGNNQTTAPIGSLVGAITQSRLAGLSVAPNNSKIAVVGTDTGRVIVYDYTAGNTLGAGASLTGGRQTATNPLDNSTQGTAWKDDSTVLAFSATGNLVSVDATSMAVTDVGVATDVVTPHVGSNTTSLYYNPAISPYVYALYSGFLAGSNPPTNSITKLYVFDDPTGLRPGSTPYALLTTQSAGPGAGITPGVDLSGTVPSGGQSSMTGRDIALDKNGNLIIGGFDSTITYLPAADFASPATIAAIAPNSSIFYYGSTYDATAFPGLDVSLGASTVTVTGDYNGDNKVDAQDYVLWRKSPGTYGGNPAGYNAWRANFGTGVPGGGTSIGGASVPEPASAALLIIGLAAFCSRRRSA